MGWRWCWLVLGVVGVGCGAAPDDEPLTPADKARIVEEMQAAESLRQEGGVRDGQPCVAEANGLAELEARQSRQRGVAGFGSRGCRAAGE